MHEVQLLAWVRHERIVALRGVEDLGDEESSLGGGAAYVRPTLVVKAAVEDRHRLLVMLQRQLVLALSTSDQRRVGEECGARWSPHH